MTKKASSLTNTCPFYKLKNNNFVPVIKPLSKKRKDFGFIKRYRT